ncbi:MAG: VanW family protein [Acidimicrobiales bacterium]|nr:VanW family protein [Acidimicrobiales bacterium]
MKIKTTQTPQQIHHPKRAKSSSKKDGAPSSKLGLVITLCIAIICIGIAIWSLDRATHRNKVGRGITVIGYDVGDLTTNQLSEKLQTISLDFVSTPVTIRTRLGDIETTLDEIGIEINIQETFNKILKADNGSVITEPFRWAKSFFATRASPISVQLSEDPNFTLPSSLLRKITDPIEPSWRIASGQVEYVPGVPAAIIDEKVIRNIVLAATATGVSPIVVDFEIGKRTPLTSDLDAENFAREINTLTESGLKIIVGERSYTFSPNDVRDWLIFSLGSEGPTWALNEPLVRGSIGEQLGGVVADKTELPKIIVTDGELTIVNLSAKACCSEESAGLIYQAIQGGAASVNLELIDLTDGMPELLAAFGVSELISQATTLHPCCASRVENIQRFAELMQGLTIQPGESLSLNEVVGKRTEAKGFVEAGVIVNGELTKDVGGGISQFATTFFQASFYGGLDILQYFPHTIWFPRYADFKGRKGVESTISWPSPNLEVKNTSPFPILIWPTWTGTSLTVSLYSTKYIEVNVSGQETRMNNFCENIQTTRRRTYPDGVEEIDTFTARYQPENGIGCDGKPTYPRPPDPPRNVIAEAGDSQAIVSWDIPEPEGSFDITEYFPITGYTVTASPGNHECDTSELVCIIDGLANETSYTFVVVATNSEGDSNDSETSAAVIPQPEPAPTPTPTLE